MTDTFVSYLLNTCKTDHGLKAFSASLCPRTRPIRAVPMAAILATPGNSCQLLATPGSSWQLRATPGNSCKLLATPVDYRQLLSTTGNSWQLQVTPGNSRQLLATPVNSQQLPTPPGNRDRIFTWLLTGRSIHSAAESCCPPDFLLPWVSPDKACCSPPATAPTSTHTAS